MNDAKAELSIFQCIIDHLAFRVSDDVAANGAAREILGNIRHGVYGPSSTNEAHGLSRCADLLMCDPSWESIYKQIKRLVHEVHSAKKMISQLRMRNDQAE